MKEKKRRRRRRKEKKKRDPFLELHVWRTCIYSVTECEVGREYGTVVKYHSNRTYYRHHDANLCERQFDQYRKY